MYYLNISVPTSLRQNFDYLPPIDDCEQCDKWPIGIRIQVPFGKRTLIGILIEVKTSTHVSTNKLKPAIKRLDQTPLLSPSLLKLCLWVSAYYHYPLGEIIMYALPKDLRNAKAKDYLTHTKHKLKTSWPPSDNKMTCLAPAHTLNPEQYEAVQQINSAENFTPFLLEGITGSGKTEVYFQCISAKLALGKQILMLVPEIALTPQTLDRFQQRFNVRIILLHSNLTDRERREGWLQASLGQAAIIIGTRSAIFTPLKEPGMIILDEEHDSSFKQQSGLRYSARDCALVRAQLENIPIILGSATPSLESLYNCQRQRYRHLRLKQRAGIAEPPKINLIDLRNLRLTHGLSKPLLEKIAEHLAKKQQIMLFINRRGYAPLIFCHQCGWMAQCENCDARLTLHLAEQKLFCHHCGIEKSTPSQCLKCNYSKLIQLGVGTERIEQAINELFPEARILRIDRDSTRRKGTLKSFLTQVHEENVDIIIGTQMLAKGHHFPKLTLVAIIDADSGLFSSEFRALERMAQLLIQVAGRAGRSDARGEVIIQTHQPQNPMLQLLLQNGYYTFARKLLEERKQASLPPFHYFALLRGYSNSQTITHQFLEKVKALLELNKPSPEIELLGPIPALMERRAGQYHAQLLIQSPKRYWLQKLFQGTIEKFNGCISNSSLRWSLDIDPIEMF